MAAIRYFGDRTKFVIEWAPRGGLTAPWVQGSYHVAIYDRERTRARGSRRVLRRELDYHVFVARGERWGGAGVRGAVTLGDLGLERPALPSEPRRADPRAPRALGSLAVDMEVIDERDLIPCRVHEDCRENAALGEACGKQQLAMMRAEDATRAKLLGTPEAIDKVVKILVQRIVSADRRELGSDWFGAEGIRADFGTHGLAVRRTPAHGPAW